MELNDDIYDDKAAWQEAQIAQDKAIEQQREKARKKRARAARKAQRKLERLYQALSEQEALSDFEQAFGQSVLERLNKYDAAFCDLEKGRADQALSYGQKSVLAAMQKKLKDLERQPASDHNTASHHYTASRHDSAPEISQGHAITPRKPQSGLARKLTQPNTISSRVEDSKFQPRNTPSMQPCHHGKDNKDGPEIASEIISEATNVTSLSEFRKSRRA